MLFRKKPPRSCEYCKHGTKLDDGLILCIKKGVRTADDGCYRFRYDPCKRIPSKPKRPDFDKYNEDDFSL